ncbi:hypothetical protein G6018_11080 [Dietzia sp. DQ11-44]|nr:hypothetical protein [Dietzia sp. Cai40]MBB1045045.1 hypothetical protein [Dietzia sp. DQ11-44]
MADPKQWTSREISRAIAERFGADTIEEKLEGQRAGKQFELAVQEFLLATFPYCGSLRPGQWRIENVGGSRGSRMVGASLPQVGCRIFARAPAVWLSEHGYSGLIDDEDQRRCKQFHH